MVCFLNDPNSQPSEVRTTQYQPVKPRNPLFATSNPDKILYTTSLESKPFITTLPIPGNKPTYTDHSYTADKYRHPSVSTVEQQSQYLQHPVHKQLASADQEVRSYTPSDLRPYTPVAETRQSQYKHPYRADKSIPTRVLYQSGTVDSSRHPAERLQDKYSASREEDKAVDQNKEKAYSYYTYHP